MISLCPYLDASNWYLMSKKCRASPGPAFGVGQMAGMGFLSFRVTHQSQPASARSPGNQTPPR